uniref:Uncharacterized protein n=1 Tax=Macrostomum lignano TaxID=282301 RepID=A0A1I8FBF3_9PLAT
MPDSFSRRPRSARRWVRTSCTPLKPHRRGLQTRPSGISTICSWTDSKRFSREPTGKTCRRLTSLILGIRRDCLADIRRPSASGI